MSDEDTQIDTENEEIETEHEQEPEGSDQLGDAGKKALDLMKAQRNAERDKARAVQKELDRFKAEQAAKNKPAEEQAIDAAKAEARAEALTAANKRILRSELKAAATGKLADPTDAALYLNLDDFEVSDDGDVDSDALREAIDELLTRKPHLAADKRRFDGGADQGAGKGTPPKRQFTLADLETMTPDQINAARIAGQLDKVMGRST